MIQNVANQKSILYGVLFFTSLVCVSNLFACEEPSPVSSPRTLSDQPFILYDEDSTVLIVEYISGELSQSDAARVNLYWDTDSNKHYVQRGWLAHDEQSLAEADPDARHDDTHSLYDKSDHEFHFVPIDDPEELDSPYDDDSGVLKRDRVNTSPEDADTESEDREQISFASPPPVLPPEPARNSPENNSTDLFFQRMFVPEEKSDKRTVSFVPTHSIQTTVREKKADRWEIEFREVKDGEPMVLRIERLGQPPYVVVQRSREYVEHASAQILDL